MAVLIEFLIAESEEPWGSPLRIERGGVADARFGAPTKNGN